MLTEFAQWLHNTEASAWLRFTPGMVQGLQTVHILGLAAVMAAVFMLGMRLVGLRRSDDDTAAHLARRFLPPLWIGLAVMAVSGVLLIAGEPLTLLFNTTMRIKLALILVGILLTLGLHRGLNQWARLPELAPERRKLLAAAGALSLVLWVGIAFAGRLIAYIG